MADKKIKGNQLDTLPKAPEELEQISFNLDKQDQFICSQGVTFIHYKAMPSPIGLKDKGEYRRSDSLDTISENGFVYKKCGSFTGVLLNNSKQKTPTEGGLYDHSTARLTLPRYYDKDSEEFADERIHLVNGDRIYLYKLDKDDRDVVNYQLVEYEPNKDNFLQFPATSVETIMDSKGFEYKEKVHFKITKDGNIIAYNQSLRRGGMLEDVVLVDKDGKIIKTIVTYKSDSSFSRGMNLGDIYTPGLCFSPINEHLAVYGYSSEYKLFVIDSSGNLVHIIEKDEPPTPLSKKEINKVIDD